LHHPLAHGSPLVENKTADTHSFSSDSVQQPSLCHLDRSSEGAWWRDLRSFLGSVFSTEASTAGNPTNVRLRIGFRPQWSILFVGRDWDHHCFPKRPPVCRVTIQSDYESHGKVRILSRDGAGTMSASAKLCLFRAASFPWRLLLRSFPFSQIYLSTIADIAVRTLSAGLALLEPSSDRNAFRTISRR
jgi:hypothetical protein